MSLNKHHNTSLKGSALQYKAYLSYSKDSTDSSNFLWVGLFEW
jgi:hypothetical protein